MLHPFPLHKKVVLYMLLCKMTRTRINWITNSTETSMNQFTLEKTFYVMFYKVIRKILRSIICMFKTEYLFINVLYIAIMIQLLKHHEMLKSEHIVRTVIMSPPSGGDILFLPCPSVRLSVCPSVRLSHFVSAQLEYPLTQSLQTA